MKELIWIGFFLAIPFLTLGQTNAEVIQQAKLYSRSDRAKAIKLLTQAIEKDTTAAQLYYERGLLRFKEDSSDLALADYDKALFLSPDWHIIHIFKGYAYRQKDEYDKAINQFSIYIEESDSDTLAFEHMVRGKMKMQEGNLGGALEDFSKAEELSPLEEHLFFYKFSLKYNSGNFAASINEINKAIALNPDFYGYYFNRGNAYFYLGKFELAKKDYEKSLDLNRENADAFFQRGWVKDTLENCSEAIIDYSLALRLKERGAFFSRRGNCKYKMGNKIGACIDWEEADRLGYYANYEKLKKLCK